MPLPVIEQVWIIRGRKGPIEVFAVSEHEERSLELAVEMIKQGYEVQTIKAQLT